MFVYPRIRQDVFTVLPLTRSLTPACQWGGRGQGRRRQEQREQQPRKKQDMEG